MVVLTFNAGYPNQSLQIGDMVYYVNNPNTNYENTGYITGDEIQNEDNSNVFIAAGPVSTMVLVGQVASVQMISEGINGGFVIYAQEPSTGIIAPTADDYFFFAKDNSVELSSITGYYSKIIMKNYSPKKAELFAVSAEISESSK